MDEVKRLGRAIAFVHQHEPNVTSPFVKAEIEILLLTGRAMDFAARLKGYNSFIRLPSEMVFQFAQFAGLGRHELQQVVLPALKRANIVDYTVDQDGNVSELEEYVGVSASLLEQTVVLFESLNPTRSDRAFLNSVELGAIAPLARTEHLERISRRGFSSEEAERALTVTRAVGINQALLSAELNEDVIFSPYVWGTGQIDLASFLQKLPPNERDALLDMSQQVLMTPGISFNRLKGSPQAILSARRSGLIQSATVHSASGGQSTYAFSPLLETADNTLATSEALHQRKLFVAHILFGHEQARAGLGRILSPAILVNSLINRGQVGPATNIKTDYHLLEAAGIVSVRPVDDSDRAYLRLVKPEIAKDGLEWIRRITDSSGAETIKLRQSPSDFTTPEQMRMAAEDDGEARELTRAAVLELRKETQRATRRDDPWA
ncbi:hypothetical protein [Lentzea sp. NPDC004782]|uniref:hypothetical protein n=1 Tax=Lentzea sp. NPDC004782 TaxID=3154458 RepID=UPI0033A39832